MVGVSEIPHLLPDPGGGGGGLLVGRAPQRGAGFRVAGVAGLGSAGVVDLRVDHPGFVDDDVDIAVRHHVRPAAAADVDDRGQAGGDAGARA
jgi:hypothetical protein